MDAPTLPIGRLSRDSGCKVPTIRYYERIGLMPEPARTESNRRVYTRGHLDRLTFIRHARDLGFTLDDIRDLLRLSEHPEAPCDHADEIAKRHLDAVRRRLERLRLLERELDRMASCGSRHSVSECKVIGILANHGECLSDHPPNDARSRT